MTFALVAAIAVAAPGALDPSFGNGGSATIAVAPGTGDDFQNGLAVQQNGRIVAGGSSDMGTAAGGQNWRLVRYRSNGELDSTFGNGGVVTTNLSSIGNASSIEGFDEHMWRLALQPDGKIVAVGEVETPTGGVDSALARFNADGTLDATFGSGGTVIVAIAPDTRFDRFHRVLIDSGGRIIAGGRANMGPGAGRTNFALARFNSDGSLDTTFNPSGPRPGIVVTPVAPGDNNDVLLAMAIDAKGKLVAAGQADMGSGAGAFNYATVRYKSDGSLDTSFDGDGMVVTPMASGDDNDFALGVAIDSAGRIVVAGSAQAGSGVGFLGTPTPFDWALVRYKPNGSIDSTFGRGGKVTTHVGAAGAQDDLEGIAIQPAGRIVVAGAAASTAAGVDGDFALARYNSNGSLDGTFGSGGISVTPLAPGTNDDAIFDIALQSDGKIVASGECVTGSTTGRDACVARYKAGEND